jgi:integrase
MPERKYGDGSVYQRKSDGRWVGTINAGWTNSGARRRVTVTAKTEAEVLRKLRDKKAALKKGRITADRKTVKAWAGEYLAIRVRDLSPKGYNAAANPIKNWVIPTIGHRRLDQLTPADVRSVHNACREAGRQAGDVHRVLHTMLKAAVAEGHTVAPRVLAVKAPTAPKSDRAAMTVDEGLACLKVASEIPHGTRWVFTLLYGARLGECLGLTWDAVDLEAGDFGEAIIEWQLQALPYNTPRDRSSGFRVPDGYEARHLVDSFHLVRPKSRKGYRVAPLLPAVRDGLLRWRETSPESPHGLVWPNIKGRPANDKDDRAEWWALQETAGVHHPTRLRKDENSGEMVPAFYHIHECRNFAATMLLESGVAEHNVTDLLGHSDVATSLRYRTVRRAPLLDAMQRVGDRLQLG